MAFHIDLQNPSKIERMVSRKLIRKRITVTSAESLTCGMFQSVLGDMPGISAIFPGGFVTYSNDAKSKLLSIPKSVIGHYGVVSKPVAIWMAKQSRRIMNTTLSISFTGVAGPESLEGHPEGTVWIGISTVKQNLARLFHLASYLGSDFRSLSNRRNQIREMVVEIGFQMINDEIG